MSRHCLTFCLGLFLCGAALPAADDKPEDREKALLQERRDALRTLVNIGLELYKAGFGTVENVIEPARMLFLVDLALTAKATDRLALCDQFAGLVNDVAKLNESRREAGRLTDSAYALTRAAILEDQVLLLRQRLKDGVPKEGKEQLRKLLLERREAYQAALLALDKEVEAGVRPPSALAEASRLSLRADLEVTDKPEARIALREATVARLSKDEAAAKERLEAGSITPADYALARAARAAAEVGLLREKKGDKAEGSEELKNLLGERRDAAKTICKARQALHEAGRCTQAEVLEAAALVLEEELALAGDAADRASLLKKYVRGLKIAERAAEERLEAGKITVADVARLKAARLDAELRLLRAERAAK